MYFDFSVNLSYFSLGGHCRVCLLFRYFLCAFHKTDPFDDYSKSKKCMGNFCKVLAAYKQVRDSSAFLYQIAGILSLLSTTIIFGISQNFPFLPFLKP